jgi:hypothetical protein
MGLCPDDQIGGMPFQENTRKGIFESLRGRTGAGSDSVQLASVRPFVSLPDVHVLPVLVLKWPFEGFQTSKGWVIYRQEVLVHAQSRTPR